MTFGDDFVKDDGFYRGPVKEWQKEQYGFDPRGLYDIIYNTCRKIIDDKDQSQWAIDALFSCANLLLWGIRYPWNYAPENMARNRVDAWISRILYEMGYRKTMKYGCIKTLSRDPFIYVLACAIHLGTPEIINVLSIPWYLWRPKVWAWHRALKGKRNLYLFWNRLAPGKKPWFVAEMNRYMMDAYLNIQNK